MRSIFLPCIFEDYPPPKLTVRPWKSMVERSNSLLGFGLFSGANWLLVLWEGNSNSKPDLSLVGVNQYSTYESRPPKRCDRHDRWFQILSWWWFQIFFIFTPIWERFPIWPIFFKWVGSTTNQLFYFSPVFTPEISGNHPTLDDLSAYFSPIFGVTDLWALRGMARGFRCPVFCQSFSVEWHGNPPPRK